MFGTSDKLFLTVTVLIVVAAIASLTAGWDTRRRPGGRVVLALGGIAGCAAVLSRPGAQGVDIIPTVVAAVCAVVVLRLLILGRRRGGTATVGDTDTDTDV